MQNAAQWRYRLFTQPPPGLRRYASRYIRTAAPLTIQPSGDFTSLPATATERGGYPRRMRYLSLFRDYMCPGQHGR
jgi:hypothetical protein